MERDNIFLDWKTAYFKNVNYFQFKVYLSIIQEK